MSGYGQGNELAAVDEVSQANSWQKGKKVVLV